MKFRPAGTDNGAHKDVIKSGTHVPAKDFNSSKKEDKAAKGGKIASLKKSKGETATSAPVASVTPVQPDVRKYEGSSEDWSADYSAAKRRGKTVADYEGSAHDRIADAAGERKFKAEESSKVQHAPEYKQGVAAFANRPKAAHGFGHASSAHDGHLRNSGHSGAHRIGKK